MNPSKEELLQRLQSLSNRRLEEIVRAATFSNAAVEVAINELRARGVDIAMSASTVQNANEEVARQPDDPKTEVNLTTVYRTDNPFTANVVCNLLQSEGLFAYLWGQNLGITHIFWSFAGGGMRVQVREDQLTQAKEIIAKFERGEFRIDEQQESGK